MARTFTPTVAEREKLKFSAMFMGATGSGKTVGGLFTAKGLVKAMFPDLDPNTNAFWSKIGVVDTEHNRAKVYADSVIDGIYIGKFLHIEFTPPYDVDGYIEAIGALRDMGCKVVIVDSVSHAWDDSGGILELHAEMGGQFSTWNKIKPIMKKLYDAFTADPDLHIITTVRSKIKYEAVATETGKMKISKIGLKPIMRDDFEYEVLSAIHFDEDHTISVIKDNTQIFEDGVKLTDDYGEELFHFLDKGVDIFALRAVKLNKLIEDIESAITKAGKDGQTLMLTVEAQAKRKYGLTSWKDLPQASLENVLDRLKGL